MIPLPPKLENLPYGSTLNAGMGVSTVIADIDFETYSEAGFIWCEITRNYKPPHGAKDKGLPTIGAAVYSEHESTEVLCAAYDLKDGRGKRLWRPGDPLPLDLFSHIANGLLIEAWNVSFERWIWTNVCMGKYGWPEVPMHLWRDAAAKSVAHALPKSLGPAGNVLDIEYKKLKDGTRLITKYSMPRKPTKNNPVHRILLNDSDPDTQKMYEYNLRDIAAEAELSSLIPDLSAEELEFWQYDQMINFRGVMLDVEAVESAISIVNQAQARYNAELCTITNFSVDRATEIKKIKEWMETQGVFTPGLDKTEVARLLSEELPDNVRRVLEIRELIGSTAVKKPFTMRNQVSRSGRLHDLFLYHAARTGRATGVGPQPQNLPNSGPEVWLCNACNRHFGADLTHCAWCNVSDGTLVEWNAAAAEDAIETINTASLDCVEYFWGDAINIVSGCLRGLLISAPGWDLICSDYSAIEAVVLAELAGEDWRREVFKTHGKIYELSASKISGVPFEEFEKHKKETGQHHPLRKKIGKIAELACFAEDTQVLTDSGYKPIIDVTIKDRLWDGCGWAKHEGVVAKGEREVIELCGIHVTPDHRIFIESLFGPHWVSAEDCVPFGSCEDATINLLRVLNTGRTFLPNDHPDYDLYKHRNNLVRPYVSLFGKIRKLFTKKVPYLQTARGYVSRPKDFEFFEKVYDIVNCGFWNRFTIKTNSGHMIVHNSGYQGGLGAWKKFGADKYFSDDEIKKAVYAWRDASPAIVNFWGGQERKWHAEYFGLEGAAIQAVISPGIEFDCRGITFIMRGDALYCRLLSGRYLTYHRPRLAPSDRRANTYSLSYEGWRSNSESGPPGWWRMDTYGGKLCENIVQATARDILAHAIINLEKAGYPVVLHVHDEIVCEVPEGFGSVHEFEKIMSTMPSWAADWPVRASGGWRAKRYSK